MEKNLNYIITCQADYERYCISELNSEGFKDCIKLCNGTIHCSNNGDTTLKKFEHLYFSHTINFYQEIFQYESSAKTVKKIISFLMDKLKDKIINENTPLSILYNLNIDGLNKRVKNFEDEFYKQLKKTSSRICKLYKSDFSNINPGIQENGLNIFFNDFNTIFVGTGLFWNGQKRMSFDEKSPSRSYLKIEEAFFNLKERPAYGETVIDLGAAPGGWSYSSSKEGAKVFAIDNGPLKDGAANNDSILHIQEDGFTITPAKLGGITIDWFLCDMIENPERVLKLLLKWIDNKWCNKFVINLKFGHHQPEKIISLIDESRLRDKTSYMKILHLFHDRQEFTIFGKIQ